MSVQDLKKFGQMCEKKETVRNRAKEIGLNDVDGLIAYGKELGLDFSKEDMTALAREAGIHQDELSEEQLEQVAGGGATSTVGSIAANMAGVVVSAASAVSGLAVEASKKW